jgi:hypothetical protein
VIEPLEVEEKRRNSEFSFKMTKFDIFGGVKKRRGEMDVEEVSKEQMQALGGFDQKLALPIPKRDQKMRKLGFKLSSKCLDKEELKRGESCYQELGKRGFSSFQRRDSHTDCFSLKGKSQKKLKNEAFQGMSLKKLNIPLLTRKVKESFSWSATERSTLSLNSQTTKTPLTESQNFPALKNSESYKASFLENTQKLNKIDVEMEGPIHSPTLKSQGSSGHRSSPKVSKLCSSPIETNKEELYTAKVAKIRSTYDPSLTIKKRMLT